jgi:hypothetical protein
MLLCLLILFVGLLVACRQGDQRPDETAENLPTISATIPPTTIESLPPTVATAQNDANATAVVEETPHTTGNAY